MTTHASELNAIQDRIRDAQPGLRLLPVAGRSKSGLSDRNEDGLELLDLSELTGIIEYDPSELTITAKAGTPIREIQTALAEHGQYLPFDPPLSSQGATLGGTVATGASGSAALRHGRIRDFIIGVRFVDGRGRLITGGGKVVKNAAGFDFPKLMVGSIGRLGVIVQLSFKVFPQPAASMTLGFRLGDTGTAIEAAAILSASPVELDALDVAPGGELLVRIGGRAETLAARADRLAVMLDAEQVRYSGEDELELWRAATEFPWISDASRLVRVPLTVRRLPALNAALAAVPRAAVRYTLAGTVAWISWPDEVALDVLDAVLRTHGMTGMVLLGPSHKPLLGSVTGGMFGRRIAEAIDPDSRFLEL